MGTELVDKIKTRGHWSVSIYPTVRPVEPPRISELFRLVDESSIEIRGWDFPHIDRNTNPHINVEWVGQGSEWNHALESWQLFLNGLFVDIAGFPEDWRDQSEVWRADQDWQQGALLGVGDVIYRYSEIFLFAARMARTGLGGEEMAIEVSAEGLAGRKLYVDDPNRWRLATPYVATLNAFPYSVTANSGELASRSWDYALEAARELFERFGWDPGPKILRSWQDKIPKKQFDPRT